MLSVRAVLVSVVIIATLLASLRSCLSLSCFCCRFLSRFLSCRCFLYRSTLRFLRCSSFCCRFLSYCLSRFCCLCSLLRSCSRFFIWCRTFRSVFASVTGILCVIYANNIFFLFGSLCLFCFRLRCYHLFICHLGNLLLSLLCWFFFYSDMFLLFDLRHIGSSFTSMNQNQFSFLLFGFRKFFHHCFRKVFILYRQTGTKFFSAEFSEFFFICDEVNRNFVKLTHITEFLSGVFWCVSRYQNQKSFAGLYRFFCRKFTAGNLARFCCKTNQW